MQSSRTPKKLEAFINSNYNFDFDTAIAMCRQGGYFDQAVFLSRKQGEHDIVVDVLIEDSKKYNDALNYIWRLNPELAYRNLMKYARVLLEHCPKDATQILIDYYTGQYRIKKDQPVLTSAASQTGGLGLSAITSYIPLAYRQIPMSSPSTVGNQSLKGDGTEASEGASTEPPLEYDTPRPRTAFSSFVDHPDEFVIFLEACLKQEYIAESDKTDLYTALFEMYLEIASQKAGPEKSEWESKARRLINSTGIPIDTSNVLLLSHLSSYEDGTILVREREGLRFDIFRSYTSAKDTAGAIKALRKYGPEEPALYSAALAYFTSSEEILEEAGDEVVEVLKKIDQDNLMAPLQVIQTLSASGVAKMGLIKKFLSDTVERERKEIENNRQITSTYRNSTASKREELESLASKPTVFNSRRCANCGQSLSLPAVHFLCKHSFHQSCLNAPVRSRSRMMGSTDEDIDEESELECPICEKENETLKTIRRTQKEHAGKHDLFIDALARSRDGLGTISEFFGRGVMELEAGTN